MIFIDLEGTLINDLEDRQILQENIVKVKSFLNKHFENKDVKDWSELVGIFTFGWLNEEEIDRSMLKILENVLGFSFNFVIVKGTVMSALRERCIFHYNKNLPLDVEAEAYFNNQLSKQNAFVNFVKCTYKANALLIDDQIERINIEYPKTGQVIKLYPIEDL